MNKSKILRKKLKLWLKMMTKFLMLAIGLKKLIMRSVRLRKLNQSHLSLLGKQEHSLESSSGQLHSTDHHVLTPQVLAIKLPAPPLPTALTQNLIFQSQLTKEMFILIKSRMCLKPSSKLIIISNARQGPEMAQYLVVTTIIQQATKADPASKLHLLLVFNQVLIVKSSILKSSKHEIPVTLTQSISPEQRYQMTLVSTFSAVVTTITSEDGGDGGEMEGIAQTVRPALVSRTVVLWLVNLFREYSRTPHSQSPVSSPPVPSDSLFDL